MAGRIKRPVNWIWTFWGRVGSLTGGQDGRLPVWVPGLPEDKIMVALGCPFGNPAFFATHRYGIGHV